MGKGGGSKSTQTVQQKADPWAGVQPYLTSLYGQAAAQPPKQFYPGQTYASQSPLTGAGQNALLGYAANQLPGYQQMGDRALGSLMGTMDVANNPYVNNMLGQQATTLGNAFGQTAGRYGESLQQTMDRLRSGYNTLSDDVTNKLQREWLPGIRSGSSLAGQYGSTRQALAEGTAMGEASKALTRYGETAAQELGSLARSQALGLSDLGTNNAQALANAAAQTQLGAYGQGIDATKAAMAFVPQQAQLGMLPAQLQQQVGAQQEAYNQKAIDEAIARWNTTQAAPWEAMQQQSAIYSGAPWQQQSTTTATQPGGSAVTGAVGGGLAGASLASAMGVPAMLAPVYGTGGSLISAASLNPGFLPFALGGALLGGLLR